MNLPYVCTYLGENQRETNPQIIWDKKYKKGLKI